MASWFSLANFRLTLCLFPGADNYNEPVTIDTIETIYAVTSIDGLYGSKFITLNRGVALCWYAILELFLILSFTLLNDNYGQCPHCKIVEFASTKSPAPCSYGLLLLLMKQTNNTVDIIADAGWYSWECSTTLDGILRHQFLVVKGWKKEYLLKIGRLMSDNNRCIDFCAHSRRPLFLAFHVCNSSLAHAYDKYHQVHCTQHCLSYKLIYILCPCNFCFSESVPIVDMIMNFLVKPSLFYSVANI